MDTGSGMGSVELAGRAFDIVEVEGTAVLEGSAPDLTFLPDGRVAGRATVNRLMGSYTLDGDVLAFGALATTMMAGPQELMDQEQRVLEALARPLRVEAGPDGDVLLVSDAGTTVLRPQPEVEDASAG